MNNKPITFELKKPPLNLNNPLGLKPKPSKITPRSNLVPKVTPKPASVKLTTFDQISKSNNPPESKETQEPLNKFDPGKSLDKIIAETRIKTENISDDIETQLQVKHRKRWFDKFEGEPPTYSAHYRSKLKPEVRHGNLSYDDRMTKGYKLKIENEIGTEKIPNLKQNQPVSNQDLAP